MLGAAEVQSCWDARLTAEMATAGRAVHEELVLSDLLLDSAGGRRAGEGQGRASKTRRHRWRRSTAPMPYEMSIEVFDAGFSAECGRRRTATGWSRPILHGVVD